MDHMHAKILSLHFTQNGSNNKKADENKLTNTNIEKIIGPTESRCAE